MFGMEYVNPTLGATSRRVLGGRWARRPARMASLFVVKIALRMLAP
jgi:hypothetical protein